VASGKVESAEPAQRFNLRGRCSLAAGGKVFGVWSAAESRARGDGAEWKRAKALRGVGGECEFTQDFVAARIPSGCRLLHRPCRCRRISD